MIQGIGGVLSAGSATGSMTSTTGYAQHQYMEPSMRQWTFMVRFFFLFFFVFFFFFLEHTRTPILFFPSFVLFFFSLLI